MRAIFAAVGGEPLSAAALQRAVVEMAISRRGAHGLPRVGENAGLAAGRFEWEAEATSPGPLVVDDGVRVVVMDGSLYYRDALRRAIAGASVGRPFDVGGDSCLPPPARRLSRLGRRLRAASRGRLRLRDLGSRDAHDARLCARHLRHAAALLRSRSRPRRRGLHGLRRRATQRASRRARSGRDRRIALRRIQSRRGYRATSGWPSSRWATRSSWRAAARCTVRPHWEPPAVGFHPRELLRGRRGRAARAPHRFRR